MEAMQFTAMVLMGLLSTTLLFLLPRQVSSDMILSHSRWLLALGTALMSVHFLLQYKLHLRDMGVTQAVMVNLLFFIPTSWLFSISIINLQRQGNIGWKTGLQGGIVWVIVVVMLVCAALIDNQPLLSDTREMRIAEYLAGILYAIMQVKYTTNLHKGNKRLSRALSNFYDHNTDDMLHWMRNSVVMLAIIAIVVPFVIFSSGLPLLLYALTIFFFIYYMVYCFICYCVSNDAHKVMAANENASEAKMDERGNEPVMAEDERQRIDKIVNRWLTTGKYLHSGITMQTTVSEMQISRNQLAGWLKTTEWELFNPWLTHLRIEEAKRLMTDHPDWSNDSIAQQCGFSSRSYFQSVFKKTVGITPTQFVERLGKE